ncbi:MAG: UDP-N-acetylglucosamine 2-epimerase (non-hydrolyzing) [Acidobacteriia bacterium]|nr:UDP-N-acetylglucosamine 2-epimerase (non-hydrolyzing) [Terriglobia bacterium]
MGPTRVTAAVPTPSHPLQISGFIIFGFIIRPGEGAASGESVNVFHIVGARPNFMKVAPVMNALKTRPHIVQTLVHTGQHYDANMSEVFLEQLGIPAPDVNLAVGSGTHARQTAEIMTRFEPVLLDRKPDLVLVYGDVNSTVAAALVSAKLGVRVGHVEAGLRSFDRTMPEEINRLLTDQLADLLFTPSEDADVNLRNEGIPAEQVFRVGNVMIDSLVKLLPAARRQSQTGLCLSQPKPYALVTLHRPANVDDAAILKRILQSLLEVSQDLAVVFPAHPRTRKRIADFGLQAGQLQILDPLPYLEFLAMQSRATVVITDSGGIQEETTYLGVPCLTLRENTERPVTVSLGTNVLVGCDPSKLRSEVSRVLAGQAKKGTIPPLWDGHAGERIAAVIAG